MNHLSRFFAHKEKIKDMESKNRSRRLDRRYAKKNIHYEPTTPPSDQPVSLRTRSLDLYDAADETNFRIDGNEGIDVVFQKIGVSGFEDFAIPLEDWEARKMRSSSDSLILSRTHEADEATYKTTSDSAAIVAGVDASKLFGMVEDKGIDGEIGDDLVDDDSQRHKIPASVSAGNGGGIKGLRPPLLAPPPVISLPKMDTDCSTWELRNSFTPDGASCSSTSRGVLDSDDEVDREIIGQREANPLGFAGRTALSASCSFTTSNDDDSSSTTTEPMSNNISPNLRIRRTITRWDKGDVVLGRGSFGSVYVGIAEDGFFFAVKEVSLLDQGDTGRQSILHLEQEIALLSQFEHENIVQYYGTDRDESTLYIFLELVSMGSLLSLYHKYPLREPVVSSYTRQILHGLKYLHEQKVVHRDIKCANILVDSNGSVKLADFGLAKATKLNDIKSCKGTPFWMAPEVLKGKTQGYGLAADIWSLGCTVLEMLTRQIPYYPLNPMQAMYRIGSGKPPPIPDLPSQEAHDFILKCLQVNPDSRPTAAQLLDHPFVRRPLSTSSASPSPSPSPSHQTPPINRRTH